MRPTYVNAFRLKEDSMGGGEKWSDVVYTHEETAKLRAEDKAEEWVSYKVHPVRVRLLTDNEGAVGNHLVTVDRTEPDKVYRERAIRKLTPSERKAIGL